MPESISGSGALWLFGELANLKEQTQAALGTFGMTEEQALSLYAIEERSEYSVQLQQILAQTGYAAN